jgi:hypothetical protein
MVSSLEMLKATLVFGGGVPPGRPPSGAGAGAGEAPVLGNEGAKDVERLLSIF